MIQPEPTSDDTAARRPAAVSTLPRVSVIIVNYNYACFLAEAIDSVFAQTYPNVECLVVDNGSTDGSAAVIDAAKVRHPALRVLRRPDNGGQTVACFDGVALTNGPYVVFLDADDYLLPHCISTHIAVHLSSRVHVGFTSADMLQVVDGQAVLSTSEAMTILLSKAAAEGRELLRPTPAALGALWTPDAERLGRRVRLVPRVQKQWVWAPTSGNCFRRDALRLFDDSENLADLKSQTDLFLALGVNAVCGSMLIDEPLFAYRLHGSNAFTSRPQMQGVLSFDLRRSSGAAATARRLILDQLTERVERFVPEPGTGIAFLKALACCDGPVPDPGPWQGRSMAARAVVLRYKKMAAAIGPIRTWLFLARRRPPLAALLAGLLAAATGRRRSALA